MLLVTDGIKPVGFTLFSFILFSCHRASVTKGKPSLTKHCLTVSEHRLAVRFATTGKCDIFVKGANQSKPSEEYVCNLWHVKFGWCTSPLTLLFTSPPWNKFHLSRTTEPGPQISNHGKQCYCNDKNAKGKSVHILSPLLSFFSTECLFTLETDAVSLLALRWSLLTWGYEGNVPSKYRRKVQDSRSTFFSNRFYCVPTLPLHSQCIVFIESLALSVHAFLFQTSLPMVITEICA